MSNCPGVSSLALLVVFAAAVALAAGPNPTGPPHSREDALLVFLRETGAKFNGVRLVIDPRTGDRGLRCTRDIAHGEVLFTTPTSNLFSLHSLDPAITQRIANAVKGSPMYSTLATAAALILESRNRSSSLRPFLASLPSHYNFLPSMWPAADAQLLEGPVVLLANDQNKAVDELERLAPSMGIAGMTAAERDYAFNTVQTRGVLSDLPGRQTAFLMPGLDMFNHDSRRGGALYQGTWTLSGDDADLAALEPEVPWRFTAGAPCAAGEETFYAYERLSGAEMLAVYGFYSPADAGLSLRPVVAQVDMPESRRPPFPLYKKAEDREQAQQMMDRTGCATRDAIATPTEPLPDAWLQCIRMLALSKREAAALLAHDSFNGSLIDKLVSIDSELRGYAIARARVSALSSPYKSTVAGDTALLASGKLSPFGVLAVTMRRDDKLILAAALAALDAHVAHRKTATNWMAKQRRSREL